jgi:hypothetical protein
MSNGEVWVTLNDIEQVVAQQLAEKRMKVSADVGAVEYKVTEQDSSLINLEGVAAEIAFCKWANCYPDLSGDSFADADAVTRKGNKVDVKSSRTNMHGLIVSPRKKCKPADVYVLMVGHFPTYRCAGYATKDEVFQPENLSDPGGRGKPAYVLSEKMLHKVTYRG